MNTDKFSLILLSGGSGSRMNQSVPKQYMMLFGKPVFMHTLERIDQIDEIDEVVFVCKNEYESMVSEYIRNYQLVKRYVFAEAGETRQASVYNGLLLAKNKNIIIHEAARPFVKKAEFLELINADTENVTFGSPISYTVLTCKNNVIDGILKRDELVNIQLPQKFDKELLLTCHQKAKADNRVFTEDASLVFYYSQEEVKVIRGKEYNLKLTNPEDLIVSEKLYKEFFVER